jgi:hypothetical protein
MGDGRNNPQRGCPAFRVPRQPASITRFPPRKIFYGLSARYATGKDFTDDRSLRGPHVGKNHQIGSANRIICAEMRDEITPE